MTRTCDLILWAKLREAQPQTHPLLCHMLDTGHVASAIWHQCLGSYLQVWLSAAFGLKPPQFDAWLGFLASMHDIGKATPAFQVKGCKRLPELSDRLRSADLPLSRRTRPGKHDILGRASFLELHRAGDLPSDMDTDLVVDLAAMVAGHHGVFPRADQASLASARQLGRNGWVDGRHRLCACLVAHWHVDTAPCLLRPDRDRQAAYMVLAGLISVADWIASCEQFFPYAGEDLDLDAYVRGLLDKASSALAEAGWRPPTVEWPARTFAELFEFSPNAMQRAVIEEGRTLDHPSLVIIEAPTGLGKTEAAFHLLQELLRRNGHPGAYLAMPTQATSNEMFRRFKRFLAEADPSGKAHLQLLHGQAMLYPEYQAIRPSNLWREDDNGGVSGEGRVVAEEWFATSKRGLLAPFAVGTVDQGLLSVLQVRHAFVRLFGLAGKVVVFDEVHAYDTYTSHLLQHLLSWLGRMGCSVILLSATLPRQKRRELLDAYGAGDTAPSGQPYPRITICDRQNTREVHFDAGRETSINLTVVSQEAEELARRLHGALAKGGCAACICNTVARAQQTYAELRRQLANADCELWLLHSRFPFGRRQEIEREVVKRFGKEGWHDDARPHRAVVVATQIIEQSLDLDFDLMVSDLAPVDLMLQRAGRLQRHFRPDGDPMPRPTELRAPDLWIAAPQSADGDVPDFGVHSYIYERWLLLRSYLCLVRSGRNRISIPDEVEDLIEQVYGSQDDVGLDEAWREALAEAKQEMQTSASKDSFGAACKLIPAPDHADGILHQFNQGLQDDEEFAGRHSSGGLTRKTLPSVRLICLHRVGEAYCLDPQGDWPVDLDVTPKDEELRTVLSGSVTLTHRAVVGYFSAGNVQRPPAWRNAPILRTRLPLVFEKGKAVINSRYHVRLDEELGIVIHDRRSTSRDD